MDESDRGSFETCAFREFHEETGFDIKSSCEILAYEKIKRLKHRYREHFFEFKRRKKLHHFNTHMSVYFLVKM